MQGNRSWSIVVGCRSGLAQWCGIGRLVGIGLYSALLGY